MTPREGANHYYVNNIGRPLIVEVFHGFVSECGESGYRRLSQYPGRFVPLVEAVDVSELEAHWPAIPDLQGGLDLDGEYPIAGEAKSDEDFAAELDAYCDAKEANANDQPS